MLAFHAVGSKYRGTRVAKISEVIEAREAAHGQKMIEVKLRFWTDSIAEKGKILPKHAWTSGVVRIERNAAHGIQPAAPKPFNSLLEIGKAIEDVLVEHGVTLHTSKRDRKFIKDQA
jgi:hypothetical protein